MVLLDWAVLRFAPGAARGAKPAPATLAGLALGFGGLVLLIQGGEVPGGAPLSLPRCGGLLLACLSWSLGSLYSRYTRDPAEPMTAATLQMLSGGGLMLLAGAAGGELRGFDPATISRASWLGWSWLVGAGSLVAYPAYVWLLKHTTPARASTYAYVNPIVAVFLGWLLLGEPVPPSTFAAAAVIVAAVALITQRSRRPRPT